MKKGLFITIEGNEGSGKSTQVRFLAENLSNVTNNIPVSVISEPGVTSISDKIRAILKDPQNNISPEAELFLFEASRAQMVRDVIRPKLDNGEIVVCDRFYDSTWVYQGFARGINLLAIELTNKLATTGVEINKTFLLDVPVAVSVERLKARGNSSSDRFELEGIKLLTKVHDGYKSLADTFPGRVEVINGMLSRQEISAILLQKVGTLIKNHYA